MPFTEQINQSIASAENAVPFHPTQGGNVTRITGQPTPTGGDDGVVWIDDRTEVNVSAPVVVQIAANNRGNDASLSIQMEDGVTLFVTYSPAEQVRADVATAQASGTDWVALWTTVTAAGTPTKQVIVEGNPSGIRFEGAGRAVLSKM